MILLNRLNYRKPNWRREYNIKKNLREIDFGGGRWMELAQNPVQWLPLMLAVLNLRIILPEELIS